MGDQVGFSSPPGFVAGSAVGVVGANGVALVDADPRSPLVASLWDVLRAGAPFDDVTEAITVHGVRSLPSIAVVVLEDHGVRALVRGGMEVTLRTAAGRPDVTVIAQDVTTWREHVAIDVESIELAVADDMTELGVFHLSSGVIPAARIVVAVRAAQPDGDAASPTEPERLTDGESDGDAGFTPGMESEESDYSAFPEVTTFPVADDEDSSSVAGSPTLAAADDAPEAGGDDLEGQDLPLDIDEAGSSIGGSLSEQPLDVGSDTEPPAPDRANLTVRFDEEDIGGDLDVAADDDMSASIPAVLPSASHQPSQSDPSHNARHVGAAESPATDDSDDDYDHLFGATQYRPLSEAGVHPAGEESDAESSAHLPTTVISGVPSADGPGPSTVGAPGLNPADAGDHDGMTISLAKLRTSGPPGTSPSVRPPGSSQIVHAVTCPSGHLNPPAAVSCRVCSLEIPPQAHTSVTRPPLGMFRFSSGVDQPVIRPMLLGRSPVAKGQVSGELPELVSLPSPNKELSGTHLEVRLDGWQVSVIDRQSTNGTMVQLPGRDPQRLHPDEPFQIVPGAVVDLAGEVQFTYLPPAD